jgi:hypothetical protein
MSSALLLFSGVQCPGNEAGGGVASLIVANFVLVGFLLLVALSTTSLRHGFCGTFLLLRLS